MIEFIIIKRYLGLKNMWDQIHINQKVLKIKLILIQRYLGLKNMWDKIHIDEKVHSV